MNNVTQNGTNGINSDGVLKETALLYFEEALFNEEFESCQELVDIARSLGAQQSEISQVIGDYVRGRRAEGPNETSRISLLRPTKEKK